MGIWADLSEWQGTVDFSKLASQVEGVILRVQAGSSHPDSRYNEYVAGCKANGIRFGTYAYGKFVSVSDAIQEAKDGFARADKNSEFFVVDVEEQTCRNASDLVPATQAYIDYLHQQGIVKAGLYSYTGFYNAHGLANVKADFHWIADYDANDGQPHTSPTIPYDMWQFTSAGHLNGVNGNVDENILSGTLPLSYFTGVPSEQPLGVITMAADSVVRKDPTAYSPSVGNGVKSGGKYQVWAIQDDWYCIGGWVYKDQIAFDYQNILVGGFTQFEIDSAFDQLKKTFPVWHMEKSK